MNSPLSVMESKIAHFLTTHRMESKIADFLTIHRIIEPM